MLLGDLSKLKKIWEKNDLVLTITQNNEYIYMCTHISEAKLALTEITN